MSIAGQPRNECCQSTVANCAARVGWVVGYVRPWGGPGDVLSWLRRLAFVRASVLIELGASAALLQLSASHYKGLSFQAIAQSLRSA